MEHSELDIDPHATLADRVEGLDVGPSSGSGPATRSEFTTTMAGTSMIVTASLTTGIARVTHGITASRQLVQQILRTDHVDWETTLHVGDFEFHNTKNGPFPNHQLRISVRPSAGCAALNYTDHDDPQMPIANSFNPGPPLPDVHLIFNGSTGSVFPAGAVIRA